MIMIMLNKSELVRKSCYWVSEQAQHVKINSQQINALIERLEYPQFGSFLPGEFSENFEYRLLYLFILDSINFCFWPLENFQFVNLAKGLLQYLSKISQTQTGNAEKPLIEVLEQLQQMNSDELINNVFLGDKICLAEERAQIIREAAFVLKEKYKGSLVGMVFLAEQSAVKLLHMLTTDFTFFQDHAIYKGRQIHFYKRAQLLIRHIYGLFEKEDVGKFNDIDQITIFPDYRLPQVFNYFKIFEYSAQLQEKVNNKIMIESGSAEEVQIRACTVVAAEIMRSIMAGAGKKMSNVKLDWFLWNFGETHLEELGQHHRTLTIYY